MHTYIAPPSPPPTATTTHILGDLLLCKLDPALHELLRRVAPGRHPLPPNLLV